VTWEEGLSKTVDWYKKYTSCYGDIENALVAHPRALGTSSIE
jgi:dTDP-D-glucose 4,6-dehydratase